jgi:hypothetical protein
MENTIKTKNGTFTVNYVPKHYNIEMFASDRGDDVNILNIEYSSDSYRLEDEREIKILFTELEPQIFQIMKFYINDNIEFYKHFDIEYILEGDSVNLVPMGFEKKIFKISWAKILKAEIKVESLDYLESLTDEQKRFAYGF